MCRSSVTASQQLSVYEEASKEAERHKWIESQKQGRDLGQSALQDWYHQYWKRYVRFRCLEHLLGRQFWLEFGADRYGQFYATMVTGDLLVQRIIEMYCAERENLDIILWAQESDTPIQRLIDVLTKIDINHARLDPPDSV